MRLIKTLLVYYLRRYPVQPRLSQFNVLSRYVWLADLLSEIKPDLFPADAETEKPAEAAQPEAPSEEILKLLKAKIQGQRGLYQVDHWLGARGRGHLFAGHQLTDNQPIVVKEYLLNANLFNDEELQQRQNAFENLAGINLSDGRVQDLRVIAPIEAIADETLHERCYLITDARDASPTLRQRLDTTGPLPARQVRLILLQLLQTLQLLHHQRFRLPSGQIQAGLIHGNVSLDSVLWVDEGEPFYVYLCDLALWERLFDPPTQVSVPLSIAQDLTAVGQIGFELLTGGDRTLDPRDEAVWPPTPPLLKAVIQRLLGLTTPFESAEAARQALLSMPAGLDQPAPMTPAPDPSKRGMAGVWAALLVAVGVGLLGSVFWLIWQRSQAIAESTPVPHLCCLEAVDAVPVGEFTYTTVQNGAWAMVLQQIQAQQGEGLTDRLARLYPNLNLTYVPSTSIEEAIARVQAEEVSFAIVPLTQELPIELASEAIAYDGLAIFVAFSYSNRALGLPKVLNGQLTLDALRRLYVGEVDRWRQVGGNTLLVETYAPTDPEAVQIFEQRVLRGAKLSDLAVNQSPTLPMLRSILQDFEGIRGTNRVGSIGFSSFSQIFGQCSVYPLALQADTGNPVQAWILRNGDAIRPETDLCNQKGSYYPDLSVFQSGEYPLAYAIGVVYLQDNSRPPIGQKFAEMLMTTEGQVLLRDAGLVPLERQP